MSHTPDYDRLDAYFTEGRLIRGAWIARDDAGRETACLLAALWPPCGEAESSSVCPASLLAPWQAEFAVYLDDRGTCKAWAGHVRRYAGLIRRSHVLTPEDVERLRYDTLGAALVEARHYVTVKVRQALALVPLDVRAERAEAAAVTVRELLAEAERVLRRGGDRG